MLLPEMMKVRNRIEQMFQRLDRTARTVFPYVLTLFLALVIAVCVFIVASAFLVVVSP